MRSADPSDTVPEDSLDELKRCMDAHVPDGPERNRAEAALRALAATAARSDALLRSIVSGIGDGLFVAELAEDGLSLPIANTPLLRLIGLSRGAVSPPEPGSPAADLIARCRDAICSNQKSTLDHKIESEGIHIELRTVLTPVGESSGGAKCLVGLCRDITDQRVSERVLRKQSRRVHNILNSMSDGFIAIDAENKISFANSRAVQMLDRRRNDLVGVDFRTIYPDIASAGHGKPVEMSVPATEGGAPHTISVRMYMSHDGIAVYLRDVTDQRQAESALKIGLERAQASMEGIVNAMAYAVEMRDPYTGGHQRRVSALSCAIARVMDYAPADIETLRIAGLLHDIGKISIPSEILNRPGKLSEPERIIVRTHAQIGYEILKEIDFAAPVALIALQHHERLDGSGYPNGLAGDEIIPEAKLLAIADVVEAMVSHRPYRGALGLEAALSEVIAHRGVKYDDAVVEACIEVFTESAFDFDHMYQAEMQRHEPEVGGLISAAQR